MSDVMTPYIVRQGDYLAKLAFIHGFDADEVWSHPKNAELAKLRADPNILAPGDILHIPVKKKEGLSIRKGATNRYVAKAPKVRVCIAFKTADEQPLANEPYEIEGLGGTELESKVKGTTDENGNLQIDAPVHVRELSAYFPRLHRMFQIRVGDMDPIAEATGIRKRLRHLGIGDERLVKNLEDPMVLSDAVASFQEAQGMSPTGELDADTRDALLKAHGI